MNFQRELEENKILLLLTESEEYKETITNTMKKLSGDKIGYVTLNKTSDSLSKIFKEEGIDTEELIFIDAISGTIKDVPSHLVNNKYYFIESPSNFEDISSRINKLLDREFDYLLFDSITTLTTYSKEKEVEKFIAELINRIRESSTKGIFCMLQRGEQEDLVQRIQSHVDQTLYSLHGNMEG